MNVTASSKSKVLNRSNPY